MTIQPGIGVALVNRERSGILYSMTDDNGHYVGDVFVGNHAYDVTDSNGVPIDKNDVRYRPMLDGVERYAAWAAKH